jgi:hypothetical protein
MAEKLIWRYATVIGRNEVEIRDLLNQAGYDGWELVSANCLAGIEGVRWIAFVKLPVRIPDLTTAPTPMMAVPGMATAPSVVLGTTPATPVASHSQPASSRPATPAAPVANLDDFTSMEEESTLRSGSAAKQTSSKPESSEPTEIYGVDFDFGGAAPTPVVEIPQSQEVTNASGPEFDLGHASQSHEKEKVSAFHLAPEQQAILTGGSLMSLDDFPVEFSMSTERKSNGDESGKRSNNGDSTSGTMMNLADFPEMSGTEDEKRNGDKTTR